MEVDFTPSIITGGSSCAVIMTGAAVDLTGQPKPPPEVRELSFASFSS